MADPNSEIPSFEGDNPKECEHFVAAIRRRALDRGKVRDSEWIALFASSHFVGDALYWYEDLDPCVQNDWGRLRPALLARFGRGAPKAANIPAQAPLSTINTPAAKIPTQASTIPTPAAAIHLEALLSTISAPAAAMHAEVRLSTIPTPAAAPPAAPPSRRVRKGCLKVLNLDGSFRGYVENVADKAGIYNELSQDRNNALLVSIAPSFAGDVFEIQIEGNDALAICWPALDGTKWMTSLNYFADCCSWSTVRSKGTWVTERKVWKISNHGELGVEYPKPGGGTETLRLYSDPPLIGDICWLKTHNSTIESDNILVSVNHFRKSFVRISPQAP